jgi:hypothetical protein
MIVVHCSRDLDARDSRGSVPDEAAEWPGNVLCQSAATARPGDVVMIMAYMNGPLGGYV